MNDMKLLKKIMGKKLVEKFKVKEGCIVFSSRPEMALYEAIGYSATYAISLRINLKICDDHVKTVISMIDYDLMCKLNKEINFEDISAYLDQLEKKYNLSDPALKCNVRHDIKTAIRFADDEGMRQRIKNTPTVRFDADDSKQSQRMAQNSG